MKKWSAAITVEFYSPDEQTAADKQDNLARLVYEAHNVVFTDTIGPPECIEECCESEDG